MTEFTPEGFGIPITLPGANGRLHGTLSLQPDPTGLIVLAHAALSLDGRDGVLAGILRHAGFSTFSVDLLTRHEESFSDVHHNVPLLCNRLLDFLALLRHRMLLGEIAPQPIGLFAANDTTPVIIRVATQRDHDIAALVCRGGLLGLAGKLYLRSLTAPLLLLMEETDEQHLASNRQALQEIHSPCALEMIPEIGIDFAVSSGFESLAQKTSHWFGRAFKDKSPHLPA